jgi:hypothetical protein
MKRRPRTFRATDREYQAYMEAANRMGTPHTVWIREVCNRAVDAVLGPHVLDGRPLLVTPRTGRLAPPCDHVPEGEMCKRCGKVRR